MTESDTQKAPHILVVDDEPLVRMSAVMTFEDMGCTAIEAGTADEALDLMQQTPG